MGGPNFFIAISTISIALTTPAQKPLGFVTNTFKISYSSSFIIDAAKGAIIKQIPAKAIKEK